ncbi:MAG TPA: aldehyde dehydrogenase family protein [Azospirillum sp.]
MSSAALPRVTYSNIATDFTPVHDHLDRLIPEVKATLLGRDRPNRIAGRADEDGAWYAAHSPIDARVALGRFVETAPAAIDRAVAAAQAAFPDWSRRRWQDRVAVLRKAAAVLDARKYELGTACLIEVGKSRLEAIGEAEEAVDLIRYYCDEMERHGGFHRPLKRAFANEETSDVLRPLGVFAVVAPFNFPLALSVNMTTAALLAGNTVVYKPSPMAGLTGALLVDALTQAGVPDGVLNLICGGAEVGRRLVEHPQVAGVAFTGSHQVGMGIHRALAAGPWAKPLVVEMGGKNPAYVTAAADLDAAAAGVMRSAFGLQGQKCSACSKVYVQDTVHDDFLARLADATGRIRVGNPEEREIFMGPVIDTRARDRFQAAVAESRRDGRVLLGGEVLSGGLYDHGAFVQPTIVAGLPAGHRINTEELFLPFLSVLRFSDLDAAIADGNRVAYGLTAGIYTRDDGELERFLDMAEAGVLYANRPSGATTGAWPGIQSFCGWKGSGISGKGGLGPYYLAQFMREQSRTILRG